MEQGTVKNELVKLRACRGCAPKLFYKQILESSQGEKKDKEKKRKLSKKPADELDELSVEKRRREIKRQKNFEDQNR